MGTGLKKLTWTALLGPERHQQQSQLGDRRESSSEIWGGGRQSLRDAPPYCQPAEPLQLMGHREVPPQLNIMHESGCIQGEGCSQDRATGRTDLPLSLKHSFYLWNASFHLTNKGTFLVQIVSPWVTVLVTRVNPPPPPPAQPVYGLSLGPALQNGRHNYHQGSMLQLRFPICILPSFSHLDPDEDTFLWNIYCLGHTFPHRDAEKRKETGGF